MNVNFSAMMQTVTTILTTVGLKILGAIAIWIIGRWLIGLSLRMIGSALTKQKIDPTLIRYIHSAVAALLEYRRWSSPSSGSSESRPPALRR
jgi:small conductance mechanosensitive channel